MLVRSSFDTFPLVIHAPDWEKNKYWPCLTRCFEKGRPQICQNSDLTILTWNNLEEGWFERSLSSRKVPFIVKGKDQVEWLNYNKFVYNIEVAETCNTKYIMGCDSHDVLMIGDTSEIVNRFEDMNCKLLFNCEKNFYPNFNESVLQNWKQFEEGIAQSHYKFLNAGAWIGETDFCIDFFRRANQIRVCDLFDCEPYRYLKRSSIGCDQSSLHHIFPEFYPNVMLDYRCQIFLNISFPYDNELSIDIEML